MLLNKNISGVLFFQTAWSLDLGKSKREKVIRKAKSDLGAKLTDTSLITLTTWQLKKLTTFHPFSNEFLNPVIV